MDFGIVNCCLCGERNRKNEQFVTSLYGSSPRRDFLVEGAAAVGLFGLGFVDAPPANALVKGNAPPPPKSKAASGGDSNKPKCRTIDECQEMAEKAAREEEELEKANAKPALVTSKGTRYRDLTVGTDSSKTVESGSDIEVYYKVLKSGKHSYDGLSGEGTVVFSRGKSNLTNLTRTYQSRWIVLIEFFTKTNPLFPNNEIS